MLCYQPGVDREQYWFAWVPGLQGLGTTTTCSHAEPNYPYPSVLTLNPQELPALEGLKRQLQKCANDVVQCCLQGVVHHRSIV
jgi:hypothetical protein